MKKLILRDSPAFPTDEGGKLQKRVYELEELVRWLRDGIQHFPQDEDAEQVSHLTKRIDETLGWLK